VAQLYPQALGTHFSRLLRHAWVTVGLFFNPVHHTGGSQHCDYSKESGEQGSSVSSVSSYGLVDRAIEVRSPAQAKGFFLCVQTGSGTHPASCTMGTGGPFPGAKARSGRDTDHSPYLVPRS
jgi:hypothetical protein